MSIAHQVFHRWVKATAQHLGLLKARLAKLRREVLTPKSSGGGPGEGFDVAKTGDARIGFVGNISILMHDSFFFHEKVVISMSIVHQVSHRWVKVLCSPLWQEFIQR